MSHGLWPCVLACTSHPATLEAEFRSSVGSIPFRGNSPSIGGWSVWVNVIQHKDRSLAKYSDLTVNRDSKSD